MANIQTGIDIIDIEEFCKKSADLQDLVLNQALSPEEIGGKLETNLGKVATKEAIMKTGYMQPGDWKKVKIVSTENGRPQAVDKEGRRIPNLSISISHSLKNVIALALYEHKDN